MGLTSFSAILGFAIGREEAGLRWFEASVAKASGAPRDLLLRCRNEAEKTLGTLRAILRENVTEMVMEPCEPLDEAAYVPEIPEGEALGGAVRILERQRAFLRDAAAATNLREVGRAFERLVRAKNRLLGEIGGGGSPQ